MNLIKIFTVMLLFPSLQAFASPSTQETKLTVARGRVDLNLRGRITPMRGAKVSLCGQRCYHEEFATGDNGMYYFSVPQGNYRIYVNDVLTSEVQIPEAQYFDIPVVNFEF